VDISNFHILLSISWSLCIRHSFKAIYVGHLCEVCYNKKVYRPFLGNLIHVIFCHLAIWLELLFVLICVCCDVGEITICTEFHQRLKPMKGVRCNAWCRLNGIPQMSVVCMEDDIRLPLFVHVVGVPQCTELRGQGFDGFDLQKHGSLGKFPCDEGQLAKVELIPLVLRLSTINL
jgi:hypothetical protein